MTSPDVEDPFWDEMVGEDNVQMENKIEDLARSRSRSRSPKDPVRLMDSSSKLQDSGLGSSLSCTPAARELSTVDLNSSRESGELSEDEGNDKATIQEVK